MRTHVHLVALALCGAAALAVGDASAAPGTSSPRSEAPHAELGPRAERDLSRNGAKPDLPTDRPIVATVVEVDGDAGRVTLDTAHGQVAVEVSEDIAQRLSPGDVVVLRLTDDDADFPSASPREEAPLPDKRPGTGAPNQI